VVRERFNWTDLLTQLANKPLVFEPGTVYSYSLLAAPLLSELLRRTTGIEPMEFISSVVESRFGVEGVCFSGTSPHDVSMHRLDPASRRAMVLSEPQLSQFWRSCPSAWTLAASDFARIAQALVTARSHSTSLHKAEERIARRMQWQVLPLSYASWGHLCAPQPLSVGLGCSRYYPEWVGFNGPYAAQVVMVRFHETAPISISVCANVQLPTVCNAIVTELIRSVTKGISEPEVSPDKAPISARELEGSYEGANGQNLFVTSQGESVLCRSDGPNVMASGRGLLLSRDKHQRWVLTEDVGQMSISVFREPVFGSPCFRVGSCAFRKAARPS
jgi:hypothetical protein